MVELGEIFFGKEEHEAQCLRSEDMDRRINDINLIPTGDERNEMRGQDEKPMSEDEIKDMFRNIFEHAECDKQRIIDMFKIISEEYL